MDVLIGGAEFDASSGSAHIGFAEFDALSSGAVHVGWCEFDACAGGAVHVGWCEFDTHGFGVYVGWCELDCLSPTSDPIPPYRPGGGVSRYHSAAERKYDIVVDPDEAEEEQIIMQILMEIAAHVLV